MKNFGVIKTKLLQKLIDSYTSQNKKELKTIVKTIKENKDFKEMYLLYEDIETKTFDDNETAKIFVDELSSVLKTKNSDFSNLNTMLESVEVNESELYKNLDILCEKDSLLNIDKKVIAKRKIVEHLTNVKNTNVNEDTVPFTKNENLLYAVLVNNFNTLYNHTLNEDQKQELKNIISLKNDEVETKINEIKNELLPKLTDLVNESKDDVDVSNKFHEVINEINSMKHTKHNYYRLIELKNGLN